MLSSCIGDQRTRNWFPSTLSNRLFENHGRCCQGHLSPAMSTLLFWFFFIFVVVVVVVVFFFFLLFFLIHLALSFQEFFIFFQGQQATQLSFASRQRKLADPPCPRVSSQRNRIYHHLIRLTC